MASLAGYFNLQEFTDDGAPLSTGRLYTYAQGTTTQKNAFIDVAGATPHTYTSDGAGGLYIALNARGELPAPLYLGAGAYDICLKRFDGSTVWTRRADAMLTASGSMQVVSSITALRALLKTNDPSRAIVTGYYAQGDGGGGIYWYDSTDTTSADNGGTIIVASDGGRWKLAFKDELHVRQFGAKCDGVTSDETAWNAAIAALPTTGGTIVIPLGQSLLGAELNLTNMATSNKSVRFICYGGSSIGASTASIILKHTGNAFDLTGSTSCIFENLNIITDSTTFPKICFLQARNSTNGGAGLHRFVNCNVLGKFSQAIVYNYGSEENDYDGCYMENDYTAGAGKVVCVTGNNILSVTSSFATIATGNQSTIINNFIGGSYYMKSGHASSDVFYLEQCGSVRWTTPWMLSASAAANGRSLVYVDMTNGSSDNCSIIGITGEVAAFKQNYGVLFSNTVRTATSWTIRDGKIPSSINEIYAGANVTLDNLHVSGVNTPSTQGIVVAGTLQKSTIDQRDLPLTIGVSSHNTLIGYSDSWTITTRTNDNWVDTKIGNGRNAWTPDTSALTVTGNLTTNYSYVRNGNAIIASVELSAVTSIVCAAGTALGGLPVTSAIRSALVVVSNGTTNLAIGTGHINGTSIYLPAINVGANVMVVVTAYYIV